MGGVCWKCTCITSNKRNNKSPAPPTQKYEENNNNFETKEGDKKYLNERENQAIQNFKNFNEPENQFNKKNEEQNIENQIPNNNNLENKYELFNGNENLNAISKQDFPSLESIKKLDNYKEYNKNLNVGPKKVGELQAKGFYDLILDFANFEQLKNGGWEIIFGKNCEEKYKKCRR